MRKNIGVFIIIGLILLISKHVAAIDIIDTGPGPETNYTGLGLDSSQWLAAEFDLNQDYIITDIYGWMFGPQNTTLTLAIYGDAGELPDIYNEFFSQTFTVTENHSVDWYGLDGLSLNLSSGTYWAAFEVRTGDTFVGAMPYPSTNPLNNEAYCNGTICYEADDMDLGIKMMGNVSIVPEPISSALFITGGVTLGFRRFWKKRETA